MNLNTKFFKQVYKLNSEIKTKIYFFQKIVILSLFFLFLGFVCGNLFGTFLQYFRDFTDWDGAIIIITLVTIELINFLNYKKSKLRFPFVYIRLKQKKSQLWPFVLKVTQVEETVIVSDSVGLRSTKTSNQIFKYLKSQETKGPKLKKENNFIKILNFYKIGLLLGFFIDAFKVGS